MLANRLASDKSALYNIYLKNAVIKVKLLQTI